MRRYAICARLGAGIMLIALWGLVDSPLLGVVFILLLAALSIARYRLSPYRFLSAAEAALCALYAILWPPALLGLWLAAISLFENKWNALESDLLRKDFEDRSERLKLESIWETTARDAQNAAHMAQMSERARIAQDIHDHVGHEIAGASLALQSAIKLYQKGDDRAGELLGKAAERLSFASEHLRETVHNLKPAKMPGVWSLEELCESFSFCPVKFTASGDLGGVYHWELLEANLKEALTNAARHSSATMITVTLEGNALFVRLSVKDNGVAETPHTGGMGLTGMYERVRAVGGTLTVNTSKGFHVICVLPKEKKEALNETFNS